MVKVRRAAGARLETSSLNVVEAPALETGVMATGVPVQQDPLEAEGGSQQLAVSDVRKEKGIQSRSILQFTYGETKTLGQKN